MCIEVDDAKVRVSGNHGFNRTKCDQVLSAEHQREFAIASDLGNGFTDHVQGLVLVPHRQIEITDVTDDCRVDLAILIGAVGFKADRILPHRLRPET